MIFLLYSLLTAGRGSHGGRRVSGTDLPEASKGGGGLSVWARNLEDPEQKVRMNTTPFRASFIRFKNDLLFAKTGSGQR